MWNLRRIGQFAMAMASTIEHRKWNKNFLVETYHQTNSFNKEHKFISDTKFKCFFSICITSKFMSFTSIKKFRKEVTIQNFNKKSDARAMHFGRPKMPGKNMSVGRFQQKT